MLRRTFSMFARNFESRFKVPNEIRLASAAVRQQIPHHNPEKFKGEKVTDIYLQLNGVIINPYTSTKQMILTPGMQKTIKELRQMQYRVAMFSTHKQEKIITALDFLAKEGIEFKPQDIATADHVDPQDDLELGLLQHLQTQEKAKHPVNIMTVFHRSPVASISFGCWGVGLASYPVTQEEAEKMNSWQLENQQRLNLAKLYEQGPNFVTLKADSIPEIAEHANQFMLRGTFPLSCLEELAPKEPNRFYLT